jgi:hypothetical protein
VRRARRGGKAWEKGFPHSSSTRLSDLPGRDEAVVQEGAQNSVRKGAHLGPSNENERAREMRALKRHGVGERESELEADFIPFF